MTLMSIAGAIAQTPNYDGIIYVTPTGAGTHSGDSWANATSSIADAQSIAQAHNAVVWVAAGIYYGDTTSTSENAFTMVDGVNVYGGFAGNEPANYDLSLRDFQTNNSILDGDSARRVLYGNLSVRTVWNGFTIQNGIASGYSSGGVYIRNANLNLCEITNNYGCCQGVGIYAISSVISNCTIHNNSSGLPLGFCDSFGGGVFVDSSAVSNCHIYSNISGWAGGGIDGSNSTISDCYIYNNTAIVGGGINGYNLTISDCYIYNNTGGGFRSEYGSVLSNSIISNNTGGGINYGFPYGHYVTTFPLLIKNSTIVCNARAGISAYEHIDIVNSIVWGNKNADIINNIEGDSAIVSFSAIEGGYIGEGNINIDNTTPIFVNPSLTTGSSDSTDNIDWHLLPEAICINQGNNEAVNDSLDLDGLPRIGCDIVDMGCYEFYYVNDIYQNAQSNYTWHNHTYTESGDYPWLGLLSTYCDSIEILHLTIGSTVGINHCAEESDNNLTVYPNPTNGVVNVQCTMNNVQFGDMELQLLDTYGRLLNVVRANNDSPLQTAQIDLSRYATGVYFVKVMADGKTVGVRKMVRN